MPVRLGFLCLSLSLASAFASDGIPPRGSAEDYPAHQTSGKVAIGAAYVPPAQVRKLFGEDLDKHGYVVFEVGVFPTDSKQVDVSADDFKLMQGKDTSIVRAATPYGVASDVWPTPSVKPKTPGNVTVQSSETIGYQTGPYGRGVYTDSRVGVGAGRDPNAPPPAAPPTGNQLGLQQQLEEKCLPEVKTNRAVAGYVFFPKPSKDKRADYDLLYFGLDGQVTLKLSPLAKP